jgi:hypothetical protein
MDIPSFPGWINGHHVPYLDVYRQLIVPADDMPELEAGWTLLCNLRDGRIPSRELAGAVERAGLTRKLDRYQGMAAFVASDMRRRRSSTAIQRTADSQVDGAAHTASVSAQDEITTVQAARQYGLSDETWRRLAKDGKIRGVKGPRDAWILSRADVIAETERRRGRGTGGGKRPGAAGSAGDAGRAAGGSGEGRERAA